MKKGLLVVLILLLALAGASVSFAAGAKEEGAKAAVQPAGGKLVDKELEVSVMLSESNLVPISPNMLHFQWMFEKTGIKIKFLPVPSADYASKKNTLLSTNDLPDIIQVNQADINNFADSGIFVNLSKYRSQLPNFWDKVAKYPEGKFTFVDGNPFGFPVLNRWDLTRGSGLVVRSDLMKELSIPAPKTFKEYYDMLKSFKAKYPASVPYVNRGGAGNLMLSLGFSLGSGNTILFDPQAGKFLFEPAKAETKDVLAYLNNMYRDKLLDPDYVSVTATQWEEKIANGTGFSYLDNVGFAAKNLPNLQKKVPTADWDNLNLPTNQFGYARGLYTAPHQLDKIYAVSTKSKNIDPIMKMFNWFYTEEACDLINLGKEGVDFIRKPNGELAFTPETVKKYSDAQGNFVQTSMSKERGNAAYESFIPYSDLHAYFLSLNELQMGWHKNVQQKDKAYVFPTPTPPFTAKERDALATYRIQLATIATEMFDKLIMGVDPIDAFDKYLARYKEKGLVEFERIYNDAYNRVK
jgi:putative aldouronate transport system substrate-binding protein